MTQLLRHAAPPKTDGPAEMIRLLRLLRSVAKGRATAKVLIPKGKSSAVALLQQFQGAVPGNFNLRPAGKLELAKTTPGKWRSATVGDFINIINSLSVAPCFATERNRRNRGAGRCAH